MDVHDRIAPAPKGFGYKSFVAWRYLLESRPRVSRPAVIMLLIGLVILVLSVGGYWLVARDKVPFIAAESVTGVLQGLNIAAIGGGVVMGLAVFFGGLRARFTFFTTVPIGGVWIGTAALVFVLAVMSGFETDLRDKILGSNAHLQIVRVDGDFTEWREIKAAVDKLPGVIASTPVAVSEVVITANSTGMPVIIKGIDPATVGGVTDLVSDLENQDRDALKRLEPLVPDARDLRVPQTPPASNTVDPAPADMLLPGEPIDFSGHDSAVGANDPSAVADQPVLHPDPIHPADRVDPYADLTAAPPPPSDPLPSMAAPAAPAVDPPPDNLLTTDEPPEDFSTPDYAPDSVIKVLDSPFEAPSLSRRTQSLPGVLLGRELVKQTHFYTGQEVNIVSPLSDPANPDANGTPIPFNRNYRVAGIFYTGMYEYDLKYVYVTLDSLQDFLDRGDAIDAIEVRVESPDDTDAFIAEFQAQFGATYRVQDWKELNRSLFSALKLEKIAMFLVLGIVILVASFAIVGNLIMVVQGKVRQIALLKTLGASDVGILQLFAVQGLMIGLIGTVLGVASGLGLCWLGMHVGLPLNPDVYYINRLPIHVDPASVGAAGAAGILISIAATLYPAVLAARVRPAAGLRQ